MNIASHSHRNSFRKFSHSAMDSITNGKRSHAAWGSLLLILAMVLFSTAIYGQSATFSGRVTDQSGAAIPEAQVVVHNEKTGAEISAATTGTGDYTVPYLTPGIYSVTANAAGFKTLTKNNIELQVAQSAEIDFRLQIGSVAESVTVQGNALLDRANADRGQVIGNTFISDLPLNGETPMVLDRLDSAVVIIGNIKYQRPFDGTIVRNVIINGGGPGNNEILLDGVSNETAQPQNTAHNDLSYVVTDASAQDFKIETNPYDAQYGRSLGGVLDQTLKSGTNQLHGTVYEYAQRTWTNANLWLNDYHVATNPALAAKDGTPQQTLDQYGAELDGPIVLPKIYDGHNKAFFVLGYENWHQIAPATITTTVPDPAWATGDFSDLTYFDSKTGTYQPITIYDPLTLHTGVVNGKPQLVRDPFPGNKIPSGRLNPTALKLLSFYPQSNVTPPADSNPWESNYFVQNPTLDRYRNVLARLSWDFSPKDRFWIRYGYWERYETDSLNGISGPAAYGEYDLGDRSNSAAMDWIHTINSNLITDLRASLTERSEIADTGPQGFDQTTLGWPSSLVSQFGTGSKIFPHISPSDFADLGLKAGNGLTVTDSLALFPNATWVKGKHTLHIGVDLRLYRYDILQNPSQPSLSFDLTWTQNCWSCGSGKDYSGAEENEGNSIASMLLGSASSGSVDIEPKAYYTTSYYAPFIQDDWRATPKLTLTVGVRYDVMPYYVERHNRANYAFDTKDVNPANAMLATHTLPNGTPVNLIGGVTFLGVNGNSRSAYSTGALDVSPRFGFAYAVSNKMVVRGGFGEFFLPPNNYPTQQGFSGNTSYVGSPDGGKTPINNLSNPFPAVTQPVGSSLGLLTNLGNSQSYINPHFMVPNVWQFSLGYQLQFTDHDLMEMSYSGDRAPNNQVSQNINHESGDALAQCNVQMGGRHEVCDNNLASDPTAIYGFQQNPFKGIAPFQGTTDYTASTLQGILFTEAMPEFGAVTENLTNLGRSWYNSLQVTYSHTTSKHFTLHATWNWAKWMNSGGYSDNNYLIPQRSLDGNDRTHNITLSGIYSLPIGRGRALLSGADRLLEMVLGGWQVGGTSIIQSGSPYAAPGGYDYVHDAKLPKPYRAANGNLQWFAPCVWTTDAETGAISASPEATAFGCTQPDFIQIPKYGATPNVVDTGIRQPIGFFFDSNVAKTFNVWENLKLQLRLDAFNVLNHPLFQNGFISTLGPNFGQIGAVTGAGQSNQPRQMQIVAKLRW